MENTKINVKKVLVCSLFISFVISSCIWLAYIIESASSPSQRKSFYDSIEEEATAYNLQFEAYFGGNMTAPDVKAVMSLVRSNNITAKSNGEEEKCIMIKFNGTFTSTSDAAKKVNAEKTYWVGVENDDNFDSNGFIRIICIRENPVAQ